MKERPILFSGPMVRALLDGSKTQTRRVVKPQPRSDWDCVEETQPGVFDFFSSRDRHNHAYIKGGCPFGIAGDALWVRENFCFCEDGKVAFAADNWDECPAEDGKWKPSIFMPRAVCRIVPEITSVRVERVASISEEDCLAEGIVKQLGTTARAEYGALWDSLNAKRGYGWAKNPWVWVIGFPPKKGGGAGL